MPIRILKAGVEAAKSVKEKNERKEKSRNPNPKTPTMMGEEKRKRFKNIDRSRLYKENKFKKLSTGGLKGNQKKLDKNNNNRIDAQDFKILRGGKKKGGMLKKDPTKPVNPFVRRRKMLGGAGSAIGRAAKAGLKFGVAGAALGAAGAGAAMLGRKIGKKLDERKARKRDEAKVQKKSVGGAMKFGANILKAYKKAGRSKEDAKKMIEALKSPGAKKSYEIMRKATGKNLRGDETFEEIMKMKKKMGGGMMNKPMGYKTGTVVEKYSPGTEGKIQKAANERLKDIKRNKRTENNPKASGSAKKAAKKQTAFYQSGSKDQMGGPFKKPISQYKVGGTVMARGCKLGRKKPTKMY